MKEFVVLENGIRLHSTKYTRDKADIPSVFSMKVFYFSIFSPLESFIEFTATQVHKNEAIGKSGAIWDG